MTGLDLIIRILGDATGMSKGLGDAESKLKGFKGSVDNITVGIGSALTSMFGTMAIGKAVFEVITEADKIGTAVATLAQKIRNFNPELNKSSADIKNWADALAKGTKFIDDEVIDALDKAITKTGDYGAAQKVVADAAKLATVANIPLTQATDMLSRAYMGNTKGLTRMLSEMGFVTKEGAGYAEVMAKVEKGYQGMADVIAGDLSTSMKKLKDETSGYFEDIVTPSLPYMNQLLEMIGGFVKGLVAVFQMAGTSLGVVFALIFASIKQTGVALKALVTGDFDGLKNLGNDIKATWAAAGAQFGESWKNIEKMWETKGKPTNEKIKVSVKDVTKNDEKELKKREELLKQHLDFMAAVRKQRDAKELADAKKANDAITKAYKKSRDDVEAALEFFYPDKYKMAQAINQIYAMGDALKKTGRDAAEVDKLVNDAIQNVVDKADWATQMVKDGIANNINSAIDSMVDGLIEGTLSWTEWAENTVKAIEKVILKMLVLKALEAGLNMLTAGMGGSFLSFLGIGKSAAIPAGALAGTSGFGNNVVVEMHTGDPSSYVRFRNQAIGKVSAGKQGQYVAKGSLYSSRK